MGQRRIVARVRMLLDSAQVKVISPEGQITDIKVLQTHPAFEKSVRDALAAWRFKPHLVNGKPASVYTVLRFTFKIE